MEMSWERAGTGKNGKYFYGSDGVFIISDKIMNIFRK